MPLITRTGKGSRLTIQEMDSNLLYLESLAQTSSLGVLNYTTASLNSSSLATLNYSTGYQLLNELPAGYYYDMEKVIMKYYYSSSVYTVDRPYLSLYISDAETPWVYVATDFLSQNTANSVVVLNRSSVQIDDTGEDINYSYMPQSFNGKCELYLGNTGGGSIVSGSGIVEFGMYYYIRQF